jgi:hypothetical protein
VGSYLNSLSLVEVNLSSVNPSRRILYVEVNLSFEVDTQSAFAS